MDKLVCIQDFQDVAFSTLDQNALNYYKSGADDEITLRDNRQAFGRWILLPRMLRDVSIRSLTTKVLGKPVEFPLGVSPTAMQRMAHPEGEVANAKAAAAMGTIYILSTISTSSIEEVAAATPRSRKWFQLYVYKDRNLTVDLIRRAEASGYEALVLTVDAPYFGKRRSNYRNKMFLPTNLRMANFQSGTTASDGMTSSASGASALFEYIDKNLDQSITWEDVTWLKKTTRLPIIVKGILTAEDAHLALHYGVDGIFVSNHGGRQLDTVSATVDALPEIVKEVDGKCEIYLDGGVSTGSDVFKAIALGAKMIQCNLLSGYKVEIPGQGVQIVSYPCNQMEAAGFGHLAQAFAGRPLLWGLTVGGEDGARRILQIFKDELDLTMSLAGISSVDQITPEYVARRSLL